MTGEVVVQRRLGEVDVAVLDPAERPERVAPVAPAVAEVEHQRDVVPEQPSSLADALDETPVADEGLEQDLDLHRAEPEPEGALAARGDVVHHLAERSARHRAGVDRRVRVMAARRAPPSSWYTGRPSCRPTRSCNATSTAESAWMPSPRRPWYTVPWPSSGGGLRSRTGRGRAACREAAAPGVDVVHQHQLTHGRRGCVGLPHPDPALLVPIRTTTVSLDPSRSAPSFDPARRTTAETSAIVETVTRPPPWRPAGS